MYITFNSIHLHNFFSFEDAEVSLKDNGFVLVEGHNNNKTDNAESNGAGKSSVFEALSWALTGETVRGTKEVRRRGDNDGCYVEIDFDIDNDNYRILRSKDHKEYKTNLFIYINGENKSGKGIRDTSELLKTYLTDMTPSLINSVILLGQGLPMRFTNNSPSGRKEVLERLSKSDFMIEDLKERVDARSKELSDEMTKLREEEVKTNTSISYVSSAIEKNKKALEELPPVEDLIADKEKHEEYKKKAEELIKEVKTAISSVNDAITDKKEEAEKYNNALISKISGNNNVLSSIKEECADKVKEAEKDLSELTGKAYALSAEITRLDNVSDICPTCGQKLPNVHKIDTTDKKNELAALNQKINSIKQKSNDIKSDYVKKYTEVEQEQQKAMAIDREMYNKAKSELAELAGKHTELQGLLDRHNSSLLTIEQILVNCNSKIDAYNETKSKLESDIKAGEEEIVDLKNTLTVLDGKKQDTQKHIDVVSKFSTAIKRDFRGYLLSGVIDYINSKAKEYCEYIFNTRDIEFKLDGNNIDISYSGKQYESLSGGEKQRIDLIIQMSIRDMLCKYLSFSCNILVLDEITDNLDRYGCEKIISFITEKLSDINSIYIISHRGELEIPYDNQLSIVKEEDGVSRIV